MSAVTVTLRLPDDRRAMALAQLAKRFSYDDAVRLSHSFDSGRERDAMHDAVSDLRRSLAEAGFAPR